MAMLSPGFAGAQALTRVEGTTACGECSIRIERVAILGDERKGIIADPVTVVRNPGGRYLVVHFGDQSGFSVFDASGAFLQRHGRRGNGPGEYQLLTHLQVDRSGDVRVWDPGNVRLSVLGNDLRFKTSVVFSHPVARLLFDGTQYFAFANIRTPERAGYPLHIVSAEGRLVRSFGSDGQGYRSDRPDAYRREIALSPDGNMWSARYTEYVLEKWDSAGSAVERLERVVPWFPPRRSGQSSRFADRGPPDPRLHAIRVDSDGRLLVLSWVADEKWQEGLETVRGLYGRQEVVVPKAARSKYWDTIIEIIDPTQRRVLAAARFDEAFFGFADPRHVYTYREDEKAFPFIDIYQLIVVIPREGGFP
jgi:hypothetical protein